MSTPVVDEHIIVLGKYRIYIIFSYILIFYSCIYAGLGLQPMASLSSVISRRNYYQIN